VIGWRKGHWPFRKGGTILPTNRHKGVGVSFEQMGRAIRWFVRPWR
jgi:hypothetical protein